MNAHLIFGIALLAISLGAGVFIGLMNLRGSRGPRERIFVRRACAATWAMVMFFIGAMIYLHPPQLYVAMAVFFGAHTRLHYPAGPPSTS